MSLPGDAPDEMTPPAEIDDAQAERLLRRRGAPQDNDAAGLFVAAVADLGQAVPAPTGALAALLADGFAPGAAPGFAPGAAPGAVAVAGDRRLRRAGRRSLRPRLAQLLAGVAVVGFATAAGAGVLPETLQDKVDGLLEATTPFEFPRSDKPAPVPPPGDVPGGKTAPTAPVAPSAFPDAPERGPAAVEPSSPAPAPPALPEQFPGPASPTAPATPTRPVAPQPPGRGAAPDGVPGPRVDPPRRETPGRTAAPTPAPAVERPANQGAEPAARPTFPRLTGQQEQTGRGSAVSPENPR